MENKLLRSYFNQKVRIYNLFGFLAKYESSYFAREAHGGDVDGRVSGEQGIDLSLHVVVRRNDVEEILDDAKIEIDAEGIGRQCNPTACHAVGEHRTYGVLLVPYTGITGFEM